MIIKKTIENFQFLITLLTSERKNNLNLNIIE